MLTSIISRILLLTLPAILTPVWAYLIAEGIVNLGAGDKDLLLLVPYMLWSVLYAGSGAIYWKQSPGKMVLSGILYASAILLLLWASVMVYSFTG